MPIRVEKRQRAVQREVKRSERKRPKERPEKAMQAGAREYPAPPFPKQHQGKPGAETHLDPNPLYDAPYYLGSRKLENKAALITGGDSGIGRSVAILFAREGADVAIVFLPEERRDAEITEKGVIAEGRNCLLIAGDVSKQRFCET